MGPKLSDAKLGPSEAPMGGQFSADNIDREADDDDTHSVKSQIEELEFNEDAPNLVGRRRGKFA
jgi:hypothetical protein